MELLLLGGLLLIAALPFVLAGTSRPALRLAWSAGILAAAAGLGWAASLQRPPVADELSVEDRPIVDPRGGYVGSAACKPCHAREHETWRSSYHSKMTQLAGDDSVLGDFDGVLLEGGGRRARLSRDEGGYWVELDGDGELRPIVMTTGSHHMQAYWYPAGEGRELGQLPFIWLIRDARWAPRNSVFLRPSGQAPDETRRWNITCNKCHATNPRPQVADIENVDTRVSEFGIACEACHGPGGEHVRANRDPLRRYGLHLEADGEGDPTIVNPARLDHVRASHVCAQCHGLFQFGSDEEFERWKSEGYSFRPGQLLTDSRFFVYPGQEHPALARHLLDDPTYFERKFWADGMIRMAGREQIGLLQTGCFTDGDMSCLSCHQLHQEDGDPRPTEEWANDQLGIGMRGPEACTGCHEDFASEAALSAHSHHAADSPGSNCYECHMPRVAYGLSTAIRTHHLESPRAATSLRTGRPLACNQCHLDRTLEWSARHLEEWYGQPAPALPLEHRQVAASIVWAVKGDATQRALTAWSLGWDVAQETSGDSWQAPYLGQLLNDPYDVVRLMAYRSLRTLPGFESYDYDFVGTPEQRLQAGWDVIGAWSRRQAADPNRRIAPELLIGADGQIMAPQVQRLVDERDHTVIELDE